MKIFFILFALTASFSLVGEEIIDFNDLPEGRNSDKYDYYCIAHTNRRELRDCAPYLKKGDILTLSWTSGLGAISLCDNSKAIQEVDDTVICQYNGNPIKPLRNVLSIGK